MIIKLKNLSKNDNFLKYFKNSSWMIFEYILRVFSVIFVGIYVARYLGPENFGILSYALAITSIFLAFSRFGMENIIVRDIAKNFQDQKKIMATGFSIIVLATLCSWIILLFWIVIFEENKQTQLLLFVISTSLIFQTFLIIDYNFQAQVKAKYSSIAKSIALAINSIIKIVLVIKDADLIYFAISYVLDHLILSILLISLHLKYNQPNFLFSIEKKLFLPLLKSALPITFSILATFLFMRTDQLMIQNMMNSFDLGLYSAAIKIYEGWILMPIVLSLSLLPAIVSLKKENPDKYQSRLVLLFKSVFIASVIVALLALPLADLFITITYGPAYLESGKVLSILLWAAVFTGIWTISAKYMIVEKLEHKVFTHTFFGLILNILLNYLLIPVYGINGAAISTLITMFIISIILNLFDSKLYNLNTIIFEAMYISSVFKTRKLND